VIEVIRPNRQARRLGGKSDPADADAAASAVLVGEASGAPKSGDGAVEMIRALRVARTTAIRARAQAINALHALIVTAPAELRDQLRDLPGPRLVRTCAAFRPAAPAAPAEATTNWRFDRSPGAPSSCSRRWRRSTRSSSVLFMRRARRWSGSTVLDRTPPVRCSSRPATTASACARRRPSPSSAVSHPLRHPQARSPGTG
jgi:hypothetical protein